MKRVHYKYNYWKGEGPHHCVMNTHLRLAVPRNENHDNIYTRNDRYLKIQSLSKLSAIYTQNPHGRFQSENKLPGYEWKPTLIHVRHTQAEALQCCTLEAHSAEIRNTQTKPHLQMTSLLNTSWSLVLWQNCREFTQWWHHLITYMLERLCF